MPRHFRDETTEPRSRDANKQLVASLTRLLDNYPPQMLQPGGGLYYGPGMRPAIRIHEVLHTQSLTKSGHVQ